MSDFPLRLTLNLNHLVLDQEIKEKLEIRLKQVTSQEIAIFCLKILHASQIPYLVRELSEEQYEQEVINAQFFLRQTLGGLTDDLTIISRELKSEQSDNQPIAQPKSSSTQKGSEEASILKQMSSSFNYD